nr:ribosome biogenesis GTPase Der [Gammaproteobacteria bacterium]
MLPVIAIVGRPNVGKSTLFNCLTRSRDALVANQAGLTRDRQYGLGKIGDRPYLVVDTGGLSSEKQEITQLTRAQALKAVQEADLILFVVDARAGLTAWDADIAADLRPFGKFLRLVVNKTDGLDATLAVHEFHSLGLGDPWPVAAVHGRGVQALMHSALASLAPQCPAQNPTEEGDEVRVAIVGRPNVGKSTLVNRLLGEDRVVAHPSPGTTRDSISIPFLYDNHRYQLIDTAGVRRRSRITDKVEKFSIVKSLQAIEAGNVVIFLIDAQEGVTDQDAHLLGFVLDSGRALVMAVNKWDGLTPQQRRDVRDGLERKLRFIDFARLHFISALHGSGVDRLFSAVVSAWSSATCKLPTPLLTRILIEAVSQHPPPLVRGRRIKLRFAHQGGRNPPLIVIHGNQTAAIPEAYRRYLMRCFRESLHLEGTPVRIELKSGANPYQGRKNVLSPRQQRKRQRIIRHAKQRGS